jgi:predicted transcriptional regulator
MGEPDRSRQASAIYALQMREAVMRLVAAHVPLTEIARQLGQSVSTIRKYRDQAMEIALAAQLDPISTYDTRADLPPDPTRRLKRGPGPGSHVRASWKHPASGITPDQVADPAADPAALPPRRPIAEAQQMTESSPAPDDADLTTPIASEPAPLPPISRSRTLTVIDPATVSDPLDVVQLREQCLNFRKAMLTFPEIATRLGISEADARAHTAYALRHLQDSLTTNADLERRLMVEQIDDMIRAIRPKTVGEDAVLDAIDRMLKLMDRKAKLLGLDQAESVDIMIRLQKMAVEGNYDMLELMDLAKDTLSQHKIRLPLPLFASQVGTGESEQDSGDPGDDTDDDDDSA